MQTKIGMKCEAWGNWNSIGVEKVTLNSDSHEPKVQVFLSSYLPLKTEVCSKCKSVIAEPKEVIRIVRS